MFHSVHAKHSKYLNISLTLFSTCSTLHLLLVSYILFSFFHFSRSPSAPHMSFPRKRSYLCSFLSVCRYSSCHIITRQLLFSSISFAIRLSFSTLPSYTAPQTHTIAFACDPQDCCRIYRANGCPVFSSYPVFYLFRFKSIVGIPSKRKVSSVKS